MPYAYTCKSCDFVGDLNDSEDDAWGDGVQHRNDTGHKGGEVKEFTGEYPMI